VPQYDLPLPELRAYAPDLPAPADLDQFWSTTLAEARTHDLAATFAPVDSGLTVIETLDVTYAGFGGAAIRGWLHLPTDRHGPLPAVVEYVGYGGGRGLAHERVLWAAAGYAHFVMDTRGQGSTWAVGATPDREAGGGAGLSVRRADLRRHHPAGVPQPVSQPRGIWPLRRLLGAPDQWSDDRRLTERRASSLLEHGPYRTPGRADDQPDRTVCSATHGPAVAGRHHAT
jgi:hypothetical protein